MTTAATSAEARQTVPAAAIRDRVLRFILARGINGATDEEIFYGVSGHKEGTIRARRVELVEEGLVADSGLTRLNASKRRMTVWIAAGHVEAQRRML